MLRGKLNLTLIPASPKQKKRVIPKIWGLIFRGVFQSVFINLSFAPASTLKHLYLCFLCAICGHRCRFHT